MTAETSRPPLLRRAAYWALSSVLAVGIFWIAGEIGLRLFFPQHTGPLQGEFDSDLGVLPRKNTLTWRSAPPFYTYAANHDSAGRRVVQHQPDRPSATALFLGDSFTYGSGVGDADTFSSVTQKLLLDRGAMVRILDAGNSNVGTDFELRYFQLRGAAEHPATVDLFFFDNDFTDNVAGKHFEISADGSLRPKRLRESIFRRAMAAIPAHDYLLSHSHMAALLRSVPVLLQVRSLLKRSAVANAAPLGVDPAYRKLADLYLGALAEEVRRSGASFRVFYIPAREDVAFTRESHQDAPVETALKQICAGRDIPLTSFTPALAAAPDSLDDLYFGEGHWKPRAHALASTVIAPAVEADLRSARRI